jgi:hypothetical protein
MAQKCRFSQVIWDEVRKEKRKRLFFLCFSRLVVCCVPSLSWQIIAGVHKKTQETACFWFWFLVVVCRVLVSFFLRWNMRAISPLVGGGSPASRKPIASGAAVPADSFNSNLPLHLDPCIDIYIYGVFVARGSRWGASLGVFTGHSETVLHANVTEDDNQPLWWCGTKSHTRHFKHTGGANVVQVTKHTQ